MVLAINLLKLKVVVKISYFSTDFYQIS